jgi:hypothetical protein
MSTLCRKEKLILSFTVCILSPQSIPHTSGGWERTQVCSHSHPEPQKDLDNIMHLTEAEQGPGPMVTRIVYD